MVVPRSSILFDSDADLPPVDYGDILATVAYYTWEVLRSIEERDEKMLPQEYEYFATFSQVYLEEFLWAAGHLSLLPMVDIGSSRDRKNQVVLYWQMHKAKCAMEAMGLIADPADWRRNFVAMIYRFQFIARHLQATKAFPNDLHHQQIFLQYKTFLNQIHKAIKAISIEQLLSSYNRLR